MLEISTAHPLDELGSLLQKCQAAKPSIFSSPSYLLILPDRISQNNVEERITDWGMGRSRSSIELTSIEELAASIIFKLTGESATIIPEEIKMVLLARAIEEMAEGSEPLAKKVWDLVKGSSSPANEEVLKELAGELDEYLRCVCPSSLSTKLSPYEAQLQVLAEGLPNAYMAGSVKSTLDFYRKLILLITKEMADAEINDQFSRANLVSKATELLRDRRAEVKEGYCGINEVWVAGISIFDTTVLLFISELANTFDQVRMVVGSRTGHRLWGRLKTIHDKVAISTSKSVDLAGARLFEVPDMRREVECVSTEIANLVKNGGSLQDMLVLSRDSGQYQPYTEQLMRDFGFSSYVQTKRNLSLTPAFRLVASLLDLLYAKEADAPISPAMISDPFRLGFTKSYVGKALGDREFLRLETVVGRISGGDEHHWSEWKNEIASSGEQKLSGLVEWIEKIGNPSVKPIEQALLSFERSCNDWVSDLNLETGFNDDRFDICSQHITSNAGALYAELERLDRYSNITRRLNGKKASLRWADLRGGFLAIAGSGVYGIPQRDARVVKFVDAGTSHFLEARTRIIMGLKTEGFPRSCPKPFLLPNEFRKIINHQGALLYFRDPETDYENELDTFEAALGPASRPSNIIFTMPYLDDRGHREEWSVFVKKNDSIVKRGASELTNPAASAFSPREHWKAGSRSIKGRAGLSEAFDEVVEGHWRELYDAELNPRFNTLEGRILQPKEIEAIDLQKEPYLANFITDIADQAIPAHEIDLYHTCPAMYYFYRFIYALGPYCRGEETGHRTYIPEWKNDFKLGPVPQPIRRMHISTAMSNALGNLISKYDTAEDISKSHDQIVKEIKSTRNIEFFGKEILIAIVDHLVENAKGKVTFESGKQSSGDKKLWRPGLLKYSDANGHTVLVHFAKCGPGSKEQRLDTCVLHVRYGKIVICPRATRYYGQVNDQTFKDIKNDIMSLKFPVQRDDKLCSTCVYTTLCGRWGFI